MIGVTPVLPEHYGDLSTFLSSFPDEWRPPEYWVDVLEYWWERNPSFTEDIDRGWLLLDGDRLVGFLGDIPSYFQVGGRTVTAHTTTTWKVLPEFRNHSLTLYSRIIEASSNSVLFNTTPNESVIKILEAMQWSPLPTGKQGRSFTVTSWEQLAVSTLGFAGVFAPLIKIVGAALNRLPPFRLKKVGSAPEITVKRLLQADDSFDQLWQRTKNGFENTNVRTSEVINWYCFASSQVRKELFACYRSGRQVGYLVCRAADRLDLRPFECLDLWVEGGDVDAAKALLCAGLDHAQKNQYGVFLVPHFNAFTLKACDELGMLGLSSVLFRLYMRLAPRFLSDLIRRSVQVREYVRVAPGFLGVLRESNSYFVRAQGDYGLF